MHFSRLSRWWWQEPKANAQRYQRSPPSRLCNWRQARSPTPARPANRANALRFIFPRAGAAAFCACSRARLLILFFMGGQMKNSYVSWMDREARQQRWAKNVVIVLFLVFLIVLANLAVTSLSLFARREVEARLQELAQRVAVLEAERTSDYQFRKKRRGHE